ncbi:MAG: hypothetical protein ING90_10850 [Rhodocyclaceae bacterium]|jgi:hypothetical protein|nr:hypothetical protein [Rhodocyclaceae bacterium]MCE2978298.1 hypothetical protein [Betaproteobacteria bacterium]MCA3076373.1 hypothetical protein [Rhodocyclaceae bacterium]MCA3088440.1 hypothetical protein [Rhodocyclaceae bacterium]MCA3094340.1 hypothetical protein [Rhodocyclaceae bacterium]
MSKKVGIVGLTVIVGLTGCATASKDIASVSVSPLQYHAYDCRQLAAEYTRISVRVRQLGGRLDEAASNDAAIMGVGLVVFWPALLFLGGTRQQEAEYARLKGEYDAVQQAAIEQKCPSMVAPKPVVPPKEATVNEAGVRGQRLLGDAIAQHLPPTRQTFVFTRAGNEMRSFSTRGSDFRAVELDGTEVTGSTRVDLGNDVVCFTVNPIGIRMRALSMFDCFEIWDVGSGEFEIRQKGRSTGMAYRIQ